MTKEKENKKVRFNTTLPTKTMEKLNSFSKKSGLNRNDIIKISLDHCKVKENGSFVCDIEKEKIGGE